MKEILEMFLNKETTSLGIKLMCRKYKLQLVEHKKQRPGSTHYDYVIVIYPKEHEEFLSFLDYLDNYNPLVFNQESKWSFEKPMCMSFLNHVEYYMKIKNSMKIIFQDKFVSGSKTFK